MHFQNFRRAVLAATLGTLIAACGNAYHRGYVADSPTFRDMAVVAVLPFENLTDYPHAGAITADLFTTGLYAFGRFKVIGADSAVRLFQEQGGMPLPHPDRTYALEVGRAIHADAVVYGSVNEFAYRLDKMRLGAREPAVAITVRMVDVKSGQVVWAASESRASSALFTEERDPVAAIAQKVVVNMREYFAREIARRREGKS